MKSITSLAVLLAVAAGQANAQQSVWSQCESTSHHWCISVLKTCILGGGIGFSQSRALLPIHVLIVFDVKVEAQVAHPDPAVFGWA